MTTAVALPAPSTTAAPRGPVKFMFEGRSIEMGLDAAWDRAASVYYDEVKRNSVGLVRAYVRLGEWLDGLRAFVATERFEHEINFRGMNRKRVYRALRLFRESRTGRLGAAEKRLTDAGRAVSLRAVERELTPVAGRDAQTHTRLSVPRAGQIERSVFGESPTEPRLSVPRAGQIERSVLGTSALEVGEQLTLIDIFAEADRVRDRAAHVRELIGAAPELTARTAHPKLARALRLLEEVEHDLSA